MSDREGKTKCVQHCNDKVKVSKRGSHECCCSLPSNKREDNMVGFIRTCKNKPRFIAKVPDDQVTSPASPCFPNKLHCPGWTSDVMQHKTHRYLRPASDGVKSSSVTWKSKNPRPVLDAKKSSKQECSCRSVDRRERRPRSGWGWLHETISSWKSVPNQIDASSLFNLLCIKTFQCKANMQTRDVWTV